MLLLAVCCSAGGGFKKRLCFCALVPSFPLALYFARSLVPKPLVLVEVVVGSPDLFHVVLRYVNRGGTDIRGRVSVMEESRNFLCSNCEYNFFLHPLCPPPCLSLRLLSCS